MKVTAKIICTRFLFFIIFVKKKNIYKKLICHAVYIISLSIKKKGAFI